MIKMCDKEENLRILRLIQLVGGIATVYVEYDVIWGGRQSFMIRCSEVVGILQSVLG